jgi:hypothetical protein
LRGRKRSEIRGHEHPFVELMHGRDQEPLVEPACPSRRV